MARLSRRSEVDQAIREQAPLAELPGIAVRMFIRSEDQWHSGPDDMTTHSLALLLVVSVSCLTVGCGREPSSVALPNGYELVRVDGYWSVNAPNDEVELKRSHSSVVATEFVVPQQIILIGCRGGVVFGVVKYERLAPSSSETLEGYFLLDTIAHEVQLALKDPALAFAKKGIPFADIEMVAPASFQTP